MYICIYVYRSPFYIKKFFPFDLSWASFPHSKLALRLRGDGAMPSIALSGPTVFGDNGGQQPGAMVGNGRGR